MTTIPRLCLTGVRQDDDAAAFAVAIAEAATARGMVVCAIALSADRDVPAPDAARRLAEVTGRSVHRLDPQLMPAPSLQRVVARAAEGCDLTLVVSGVAVGESAPSASLFVDGQAALHAPVALCVDVEAHERAGRSIAESLEAAGRFTDAHGSEPRVALLAGAALDETIDDAELDVLTFVRSASPGDPRTTVPDAAFAALVRLARRAPTLPPPVVHARVGLRARVGVVMDECFDLHDEESLVQFEVAGAELAPVSALHGDDIPDLDGLIVGDGRIERFSAALAAQRSFRSALGALVTSGVPTIASGGGFAYLTRGLRTLSGALHPFVGAIDAEAVAIGGRLPRGHVEVETAVDTVIGAAGTRIRGYVQREWLVRDLAPEARGIYVTLSGPPDEGGGAQHLFATHFRPYWPSCPDAARSFVDRCALQAAARDARAKGGSRREPGGSIS